MAMEIRRLGLYLHIPFCVRKCSYCDFLSAPAASKEQYRYVRALCRQIKAEAERLTEAGKKSGFVYCVDTVFIGGGTPSVLEDAWLIEILDTVRQYFAVAADAEITMECNPGTVTEESLSRLRLAGVNRLSIGVQSANDRELALLGRIHTWEDVQKAFRDARSAGFDNINLDLISALPGQTVESLAATLGQVLRLEPEHISVYSLIIEEGTAFFERYADGSGLPDEDLTAAMDELIWRVMEKAGYERYEISNYARPGHACRHNLKYWSCEEYLGCGIGAASYMRGDCGLYVRWKMTADRQRYADTFLAEPPESSKYPLSALRDEWQELSRAEEMEEYVFLGLRKSEGISVAGFETRFARSFAGVYGEVADRYLDLGLMRWEYDRIFLTQEGMEVSNRIMADFLLDDETI